VWRIASGTNPDHVTRGRLSGGERGVTIAKIAAPVHSAVSPSEFWSQPVVTPARLAQAR